MAAPLTVYGPTGSARHRAEPDHIDDAGDLMDDSARDPVPQAATAGEYVVLLGKVRRCSGLTYREISRRSSAAGHWLPPSTLATMLGRTTLPRERTVVALLVGCGMPAGDIERWVGLRRDIEARLGEPARGDSQPTDPDPTSPDAGLAAVDPAEPQQAPAEADRASRPARRRLRLGVLVLVGALVGALAVGASGALLSHADGDGRNAASTDGCPLVLRQGMYGPCVLDLQERLVAGGLRVPVDGWFGPDTASRVMAFQALGGLPVSGTVDGRLLDELSGDPMVPASWPEDRISSRLRETFPEDPAGAVRLARCLSGLDPYRIEVLADGSRRWGLFQFSDMELSRLGVDRRTALDPDWSIGAARDVWSRTGDFGHWRCAPS
ncbi:peptidoglycan-binding protein [Micromonospora sp. NBC_01655]|uniref:peptidoglycan-binding domain-containing protein n=1 Tax=Micromonospora sp. NBC_01655 TaxID=2975983 RepID=UPI002252C177|nr:peptidoglycan-binding protein [Micromonospora sp. NBC_01655]MCX4471573.1 peptidoglycan-binding protein [Micromonospora sp. NBC_01655]